MKHIFIINPVAGKGKAVATIEGKINDVCRKLGVDYEIYITEAAGAALKYTKKRASSGEELRFYACGGDGTLYEVVNGAFGFPNAQVAVIPLGSGNDFIRLFGTKEDFLALENVINGVPTSLDVIKCGEQIAINQCSMGLDAEVCARQANFKKIPFMPGEAAYYAASLYSLMTKVKNKFTISIDDGEPFTQNCLFCLGGNSRWYGGGFKGAPLAIPNDGLLDFIIVESNMSRLKLLTLLNPYKAGEHLDWDITKFVRGKKITIHCDTPAAVNVDGECQFVTDSSFEIIENGIVFVVPQNSAFLTEKTMNAKA